MSVQYATLKKSTAEDGTDYYHAFFVPKDIKFALKIATELVKGYETPEILHISISKNLVTLQISKGKAKKLNNNDFRIAESLILELKHKKLILGSKEIESLDNNLE